MSWRRKHTEFLEIWIQDNPFVGFDQCHFGVVLDSIVAQIWIFFKGHAPFAYSQPFQLWLPATDLTYLYLVKTHFNDYEPFRLTRAFCGFSPLVSVVQPHLSFHWTMRQIIHELTHQFLRRCQPNRIQLKMNGPVWLEEGMAEYCACALKLNQFDTYVMRFGFKPVFNDMKESENKELLSVKDLVNWDRYDGLKADGYRFSRALAFAYYLMHQKLQQKELLRFLCGLAPLPKKIQKLQEGDTKIMQLVQQDWFKFHFKKENNMIYLPQIL